MQSMIRVFLSSEIQYLLEKEKMKISVGQRKALPKMYFKPHKGHSFIMHSFMNTMHLGTEIIILTQHKNTGSPLTPEPKDANISDSD